MTEAQHTSRRWVIGDSEGVIHEGTEEEMQRAIIIMTFEEKVLKNMYSDKQLTELKAKYRVQHAGKLLMTQL